MRPDSGYMVRLDSGIDGRDGRADFNTPRLPPLATSDSPRKHTEKPKGDCNIPVDGVRVGS